MVLLYGRRAREVEFFVDRSERVATGAAAANGSSSRSCFDPGGAPEVFGLFCCHEGMLERHDLAVGRCPEMWMFGGRASRVEPCMGPNDDGGPGAITHRFQHKHIHTSTRRLEDVDCGSIWKVVEASGSSVI